MKRHALACALPLAFCALPAAAQGWYEPAEVIQHSYVELEGGASVQGSTKVDIAATGLGSSAQSASHDDRAFGGALIGYNPVPGVAFEAEGFYSRDNLSYAPTNPVFGVGGAERLYGGFGNLRLSLPFIPALAVPLGEHGFALKVEPYVSPGVGRGAIQYTGQNGIYSYEADRNGLIWQAKAGVEIRAGRHLGLDIAYRYIQAPDFAHPDAFNSPGYSALARSHVQVVTAGLKYHF